MIDRMEQTEMISVDRKNQTDNLTTNSDMQTDNVINNSKDIQTEKYKKKEK